MRVHRLSLFKRLTGLIALLPLCLFGDQSDHRLDGLFATLKSDDSVIVQSDTIQSIWTIWYEHDNNDINKLMEQGSEAIKLGQMKEAEQIFSQIIEQSPDFSEGWNRRATVRFNRGDYRGSLADIKQTLRLEPRHFGAIWGRGMILGLQGDFSGAIEAFKQMLQITPYSEDAKRRIELLEQELRKTTA